MRRSGTGRGRRPPAAARRRWPPASGPERASSSGPLSRSRRPPGPVQSRCRGGAGRRCPVSGSRRPCPRSKQPPPHRPRSPPRARKISSCSSIGLKMEPADGPTFATGRWVTPRAGSSSSRSQAPEKNATMTSPVAPGGMGAMRSRAHSVARRSPATWRGPAMVGSSVVWMDSRRGAAARSVPQPSIGSPPLGRRMPATSARMAFPPAGTGAAAPPAGRPGRSRSA
jgi:hypothetical protein